VPRPEANLVITDVHVPWQNERLIKRVCQLAMDVQFDGLYIGGDTHDLYTLSRHNQRSLFRLKDITLAWEYERANKFYDDLLSAVGKKCRKRKLVYGNHEDNYTRWMHDEDHAKLGEALLSPIEACRLRERGFEVRTDWKSDSFRIGDSSLELAHGEYCTVHAAKKHLDEYEGSVMFGHTHRFQTFITGQRAGFNIGGLFDKDSIGFKYATASQRRRWCNGFAVVYVHDNGSFNAVPVNCWNGKFVFNGKLY
jgi:predicted phosphodiesterase